MARKGHRISFMEVTEEVKKQRRLLVSIDRKRRKEAAKIRSNDKKSKIQRWKRNRIVRLRNAVGSFTHGEWELLKKQYGNQCLRCEKKEPEIKLTVDHIIPLSNGGSNCIENIQPLCKRCNCVKHTKIIDYRV